MPGLVHAVDSYANTVATMRNVFLTGLAIVIAAVIVICRNKKK